MASDPAFYAMPSDARRGPSHPLRALVITGVITDGVAEGTQEVMSRKASRRAPAPIPDASYAQLWLAEGGEQGDLMALAGSRLPSMVNRYAASYASDHL